jgi:hypothetical protein
LNALLVYKVPLAPQQYVQPSIAKAPTLSRQNLQPGTQGRIVWPLSPIPNASTIDAQNPAGVPLAHLMRRPQIRRCLTARRRRHHFFPSKSFNAALSSIASASIRLSLPFSSSSVSAVSLASCEFLLGCWILASWMMLRF